MRSRLHLSIGGAVQGVGFRPFVYRLATDLGLTGWIQNAAQGLALEVEGPPAALRSFKQRLQDAPPPHASIQRLQSTWLAPRDDTDFTIRPSDASGAKSTHVLPDLATCADCLRELFDPNDRRYLYPFINCTHCGSRFTIMEALPYDRVHTTMRHFRMCDRCRAEYNDPHHRRFHAQPNACPACGPSVALWDRDGGCLSTHHDALIQAIDGLRHGAIVAVKGLGGFHLIAEAQNEVAIARLRQRKHREEKPFALMMPSLEATRQVCDVSPLEAQLLCSPASPIVLLRRKSSMLPNTIAPGTPNLGVMLPYTPLHHLMTHLLGAPVVATSGNRAHEPLCTDEQEALDRLAGIADMFLVHNRPIARHVDDSITQITSGTIQLLRRARGYAPLSITWQAPLDTLHTEAHEDARTGVLAVGAHLKNTIAIAAGRDMVMSQYLGDLETAETLAVFQKTLQDIPTLHAIRPYAVVCDTHPDYGSTRHAASLGLPLQRVQHHVAHVFSCMADNDLSPPVLGVAWDGSGYGLDGTIWGGEFLHVTETNCHRAAHLRPFPLPGSDQAIKAPWRTALGLLYTRFGDALFDQVELTPIRLLSKQEKTMMRMMLAKNLNSPLTSSVGRLFDAVASLIGLRQVTTFEGQAAMALEFVIHGTETEEHYPFLINGDNTTAVIDWSPLLDAILDDSRRHVSSGLIAARFHNTLVEIIVAIAKRCGEATVALTGGCFQNRYLSERSVERLKREGFHPFWHQRVPPNDGGIALGQLAATRLMKTEG